MMISSSDSIVMSHVQEENISTQKKFTAESPIVFKDYHEPSVRRSYLAVSFVMTPLSSFELTQKV